MKQPLLVIFFVIFSFSASAQVTNIPDPLFEQLLIDMEIDTDELVNGQMATADALALTSLEISYPSSNYPTDYISDLTGIEAFTNLENLTVNGTLINDLNVSTLASLKHLNVVDNELSFLDLSNNPLLETLHLHYGGDLAPMNYFEEIDLSNNPQIQEIKASGIGFINLKNGNNNPNTKLYVSAFGYWDYPPDYIVDNICIEVDDETAAQNNEYPYSEWTINHSYRTYSLVNSCTATTENFASVKIFLYPNPTSNILNIEKPDDISIDTVQLYDISGRFVKEFMDFSTSKISLEQFEKGIYFLKIFSGNNSQTQKVVLE